MQASRHSAHPVQRSPLTTGLMPSSHSSAPSIGHRDADGADRRGLANTQRKVDGVGFVACLELGGDDIVAAS
jgi:hypothetical protein